MKNIFFGSIILLVTVSWTIENGKLSGVVKYKDSYGSSNQADAGSEIYAINEADLKSSQYENIAIVLERFQINKSGYSLATNNTIDPVRIKKAQDFFDTVSNSANKYIRGFKQLPAIIKASTNGTGNYTLSLKPGRYFILVISGSVKSNNIVELKGNIDYKIVDIKSAGETFLDFNFVKHELMWIKIVTPRQPEGC
jgi:hypothetical protein